MPLLTRPTDCSQAWKAEGDGVLELRLRSDFEMLGENDLAVRHGMGRQCFSGHLRWRFGLLVVAPTVRLWRRRPRPGLHRYLGVRFHQSHREVICQLSLGPAGNA